MIDILKKLNEIELCINRQRENCRGYANAYNDPTKQDLLCFAEDLGKGIAICAEMYEELLIKKKEIERLKKDLSVFLEDGLKKYGDIPKTFKKIDDCRNEIPVKPGIYFLSNCAGGDVRYVGKSSYLQQRLTYHPHSYMLPYCAWRLIKEKDLDYAECFYIGTIRPDYNFACKDMDRGLK